MSRQPPKIIPFSKWHEQNLMTSSTPKMIHSIFSQAFKKKNINNRAKRIQNNQLPNNIYLETILNKEKVTYHKAKEKADFGYLRCGKLPYSF